MGSTCVTFVSLTCFSSSLLLPFKPKPAMLDPEARQWKENEIFGLSIWNIPKIPNNKR